MDNPQSFQGKKFIHFADAGTFRCDQRRQPSRSHDLGAEAVLLLNSFYYAVDQAHVAVKNSGLDRVNGISADDFFRLDNLDARQFDAR